MLLSLDVTIALRLRIAVCDIHMLNKSPNELLL